MDQNQIVGRKIATGKVKVEAGEKKDEFHFQHGSYEMTVDDGLLERYGSSKEAIEDCLKKLQSMGTYEELAKAHGYKPKDGEKNSGLVIVSDIDPRVSLSVQFGSKWPNDADYLWLNKTPVDLTLTWFLDTDGMVKEMGAGAVPERPVADAELDLISKIREETKEQKIESYQPMLKRLQAFKEPSDWTISSPEQLIESKGRDRMKFHEDFDSVDFFGMPVFESAPIKYEKVPEKAIQVDEPAKKDKEVEAKADEPSTKQAPMKHVGDAIAKAPEKADIGVKSGEAELPAKEVKVGDAGEEDGKGEVVAGQGKSDDQQDELAKGDVKLGKPGDDHGKVMSEAAIMRRRYARVVAENRMLKGKLSQLLDRVTKIEEAATAKKATVAESKMGMARQRMELKKASMKERMSEMKKPMAKKPMAKKPMAKKPMKMDDKAKEMSEDKKAVLRERIKARMEERIAAKKKA